MAMIEWRSLLAWDFPGSVGDKLRADALKVASKESLVFICTMIGLQLTCVVAHFIMILSDRPSVVPIYAMSITLIFHVPCAVLLRRYSGQSVDEKLVRGRRLGLAIVSSTTLIVDTVFLALSRADVQHYLHYKMKFVPESVFTAAYNCEEAGDLFSEVAEDMCLLGQSQMMHTLALFWSIFLVLFVVSEIRYLVVASSFAAISYTAIAYIGVSSLHLEASEEYGSLFLYSDLIWWIMCLATMVVARVRLDRAKHSLLVQLENQNQQTIKEKVLRCEAEFKNSNLEEIMSHEHSGNKAEATSSYLDYSLVGDMGEKRPFVKKAPSKAKSSMSCPAFISRSETGEDYICEAEDGDCLPPDCMVWVDGFSVPKQLSTCTAGQRVLCYDSLSSSIKYANVMDIGPTGESDDRKWVTITLVDGTDMQMTADHPVQCYKSSTEYSRKDTQQYSKLARDVTVGADSIMVMRTAAVPVRSISSPQVTPKGQTWKINVQQPDRHTVFVAKSGKQGAANIMALGPSNLRATGKTGDDTRTVISAPEQRKIEDQNLAIEDYRTDDFGDASNMISDLVESHVMNFGDLPTNNSYDARAPTWNNNIGKVSTSGGQTSSSSENRDRKDRRRCEYKIATHLAKLDSIDPKRVLKLRNIASLGFNSALIIRQYLAKFGNVDEVLLSGSEDETPQPMEGYRHRPSRFCFVVMNSQEEAAAVLRQGAAHNVSNTNIIVERFVRATRKSSSSTVANADEDEYDGDSYYGNEQIPFNDQNLWYQNRFEELATVPSLPAKLVGHQGGYGGIPASIFWPHLRLEL